MISAKNTGRRMGSGHVGAHPPSDIAGIVSRTEVVEPRFVVSFFAGKAGWHKVISSSYACPSSRLQGFSMETLPHTISSTSPLCISRDKNWSWSTAVIVVVLTELLGPHGKSLGTFKLFTPSARTLRVSASATPVLKVNVAFAFSNSKMRFVNVESCKLGAEIMGSLSGYRFHVFSQAWA